MAFDIEDAQAKRIERKEQRDWPIFEVILPFKDGHAEVIHNIKTEFPEEAVNQAIAQKDTTLIIHKDCRAKNVKTKKVFTFDGEPL